MSENFEQKRLEITIDIKEEMLQLVNEMHEAVKVFPQHRVMPLEVEAQHLTQCWALDQFALTAERLMGTQNKDELLLEMERLGDEMGKTIRVIYSEHYKFH